MKFVKESVIAASVDAVFAFHERPDAFALLQPPWERTRIITPPRSLEIGTRVELETRVGPAWVKIVAEHVGYERNRWFEDVMIRGPFKSWRHKHIFFEHDKGCRLRDEIEYRPPLGPLGRLADPLAIRPKLQRLFDYRHEITAREVLATRSD